MKRIIWILVGIAVVTVLWYLFIRPFEFEVKIKAHTLPGDVIEMVRTWNRTLDSAKVVEVDSFERLKQNIVWKDRSYVYDWHFEAIDDSTTYVNIRISQPSKSLTNKLLIPVTNTDIEKDASDISHDFYEILKGHLKITNVQVVGEAELRPTFCVCSTLETKQIDKARGMMKDYGLLTSLVADFNLKANGLPIVKIRKWSHNLGTLQYDFCFPIAKTDSLPVVESISYKELKKEKVLKAVYHGNYITSDRAWYALIQYAKSHGYKVNGLPIEYFYNNPNLGDEMKWKADIYLPIK